MMREDELEQILSALQEERPEDALRLLTPWLRGGRVDAEAIELAIDAIVSLGVNEPSCIERHRGVVPLSDRDYVWEVIEACARRRTWEPARAAAVFALASELDADDLVATADLFVQLNQEELAHEVLLKGLAKFEDHPALLCELGRLLINDAPEQALRLLLRAEGRGHETADCLCSIGHLLVIDPARKREAEAYFRRAIAADEHALWPRLYLATWLEEQGELEEAERCFVDASMRDEPCRSGAGFLGNFYAEHDRFEEADAVFRTLLEGISADNLFLYARMLSWADRDDEARAALKSVIEQDPTNERARMLLARLDREKDDQESEDQQQHE